MNWPDDAFWLSALAGVLIKGSVLLLVAAVLNLALRRSSAAARHLVWGAALLSLPLVPLLTLLLPSWNIPVSRTMQPSVRSVVNWITVDERPAAAPGVQVKPPASPRPAGLGTSAVEPVSHRPGWIGMVWVGGVLFALAPWLIGLAAARRQVRRGKPLASAGWRATIADLSARLGIRGRVRVLAADDAAMPMTWGLLRPVILLPQDAQAWPVDRQIMVLAHELAHVKRRDCLAQTLVRIVCGLCWFHPLAWYAARQFLKERERAADDLVLGLGTRASDYAQQLLEFARSFAPPRAAWAALAIARRSGLEGRLLAILDTTRKRGGIARVGAVATLAAFAGLVPLLAMVTPVEARQAVPASAQQIAGEPAEPSPPPSVDTQVPRETLPATQAVSDYPQLDRLAERQLASGDYDLARETYQRSLEAREKAFGSSSAEAAAGLLNLGRAIRVADGLEKAEAVYRRAQDILGTGPQPELLEYFGMLAQFRKEYAQADEFYRRALALVGPNTLDAARIITHQAVSAELQGSAPQAEQLYRQAMAIAQAAGPETPQMAVTLEHLARLLRDSGRGAEGDDAVTKALQIRVRRIAERWPDEEVASAGGKPVRVGGFVTAPVVIRKVEPRYDDEARLIRYQSTVVLSVVVGVDGQVHNIRLEKPAGFGLDERAVEAVKQWRFRPAAKEGQPVPVLATIEVNFRLL